MKDSGEPIKLGYQTRIRINIQGTEAAPEIREILPQERFCNFHDEKSLRYYKYYTRRNCELECDADFIYKRCMCIPFHLPRLNANETRCDVQHFDCERVAELWLNKLENLKCKVQCLPACNELTFYGHTFDVPLVESERRFIISDGYVKNISREEISKNLAIVSLYFRENNFRRNIKSPYTGGTEYICTNL